MEIVSHHVGWIGNVTAEGHKSLEELMDQKNKYLVVIADQMS